MISVRRILHLTIHLSNRGGAEHQLIRNVKALDNNRFENLLCCVEKPRDLALEAAEQGIPVFSLECKGKLQWLRAIYRLCILVRSQKIDLIHTSLFDADIVGGIAGRLCGVPVVSTLCNIGAEKERLVDNPNINRFKLMVTMKLWGLTIRSCHQRSIAISDAVKESAIRTYGLHGNRLKVIYRSLDPNWNDPGFSENTGELRRTLGLEDTYPVLLNVARLYPQKGQKYLIQAMPEIIKQFPNVRLLIVGLGPLQESLTSLCRDLGVEKQVIFLGHRGDVRNLLELTDVFVFPSLFEGLGGALIEATGAGRPCVASKVGPIPEVVEDGESGVLVPSQSPAFLAKAIIQLGRERDRARLMGERGKQIAAERFSINQNIRHLEEFYDLVLGPDEAYSF